MSTFVLQKLKTTAFPNFSKFGRLLSKLFKCNDFFTDTLWQSYKFSVPRVPVNLGVDIQLTSEFILQGPPEVDVPGHMSFPQYVYDRLKAGGHNVAQICAETGKKVTFIDILQRSVNIAVSLRKLGIKRGDVVCISAENRFEFTETTLAIMFCGAAVTTSNVSYTKEDLMHTLKLSKPKIIFYSPLSAKQIPEAKTHLPSVETLIYYGDESTNGSLLYKDLLSVQYDIDKFQVADVTGQVDTLLVLYSSGTTGLPKGVMLTHLNVLLVMRNMRYALFNSNIDGNTKSYVMLSVLPWFHAYGFLTHLVFLCHHVPVVFMHRFNEELFLRSIQNYKVSICFLVPPIIVFLAKHPVVDKYNLTSLKEIWSGAAPLSKELQDTVTKRLNIKYLRQGYGMTELTLAVTMDLSNERRNGTAGKLMPGLRGKVIDIETDKLLGPYQNGQLCFKSEMKMKGYIGDPAASSSILDKDGYICTGDVGYYDEDGFFYIVDRIKELIKYKGFQVAPAELEALLLQHPGVRDAAVTAVPDEQVGELPIAFIVKQPNTNVTEKDIIDFVASKVTPSKYLRGGVKFVNEIPKNPSGKIIRRKLKENLIKSLQCKL